MSATTRRRRRHRQPALSRHLCLHCGAHLRYSRRGLRCPTVGCRWAR